MKRKYFQFGVILCVMLLVSLSCNIITADYNVQKKVRATMDAQETLEAQGSKPAVEQTKPDDRGMVEAANEPGAQNNPAIKNPDDSIVFSYAGENQSYHTGLRNKTVFYIDYQTGAVLANEEASFEESAGTNRTRRGIDSVKFNGTYNKDSQSISGELIIYTEGNATGAEDGDDFLTYRMNGILNAHLVDGQWIGTVTGSATLRQGIKAPPI